MKRFLVLLVLVAGGLAAASLSVPTNAAVVNGQAISEDQLTSDVSAIANSQVYRCFLNAQIAAASQTATAPLAVDGAGQQAGNGARTTATATFVASQLNTDIEAQLVSQVAAAHHVRVTPAELKTARQQFRSQFTGTVSQDSNGCGVTSSDPISTLPDRLVQENVRFYATISALEQKLSGIGSSTTALTKFFDMNRPIFDQVCFSAATFSSAKDAQAARVAIYEGATFASIASKTTGGGPQGCEILYSVVAALPATADVQGLPLDTPSDPIALNNGEIVLLEITARSPNHFSTVKTAVQQAVGTIGANQARAVISAAQQRADVVVNPRYGKWQVTSAQILVPTPPPALDVGNAAANSRQSPLSGQSG